MTVSYYQGPYSSLNAPDKEKYVECEWFQAGSEMSGHHDKFACARFHEDMLEKVKD
jgi:hypothetical protein